MDIPKQAALLRIYTEEAAREGRRALYQSIILKARDQKIAGATVLRGPMGYGQSTHLHNANILDLSGNLPLVIEIVDEEAKLRGFVTSLESMQDIGLITIEKVEVLHYGNGAPRL